MKKWVLAGLFLISSVPLAAQTLNARIMNARVDGPNFKWDVQIRRTDDWGSGGGDAVLGNCDFYFYVNAGAFTGAGPSVSGIHSALSGGSKYGFRTGRAASNTQCWIALDYNVFGSGSDWYPALNTWETVFTASLPIANYNQESDVFWHTSSTGFSRGNMQPLNDVLSGSADIVLFVLTINDVTQYEGDAGPSAFSFTVSLNQPSSSIVTVNYQTADLSATAGSDYTAVSSTMLSFTPGQTSRPVDITVSGDTDYEPDEVFYVNLSGAVNAIIQDARGTGTILNEDVFSDIDIRQGTARIRDGGAYDFGVHLTQTKTDAVFTITNNGTGELILGTPGSVPIVILGQDYNQFSVRQQPGQIVPAGQTTTFTIRFQPASPGSKRAVISIATNDLNENPFDIILLGSSLNPSLQISDIPDQTLPEDGSAGPVAFTVNHELNGPEGLIVTAMSDNQDLLPDSSLVVLGNGGDRTLTIKPAADMFGTAVVTVTVSDGSGSNSDALTVTVTPVNDPPVIGPIGDITMQQDGVTSPVLFTVQDPETAPDELTVSCTSGDADLLPETGLAVAVPEGTEGTGIRSLVITPAAGASGQTTVTVTVSDGELSAEETFTLTVTPWPVFTLTTVSADTSAGTITPETADYDSSVYVDVTALPKPGYLFSHWSGDAEGTGNPVSVIMDHDKTVTAHFMVWDTLAPELVNIYPPPGGVALPENTWLQFKVADEGTGPDRESLQVSVNGTPVIADGADLTGGLTEFVMRGNGMTLICRPETPVTEDTTVIVTVQCSDRAIPPNSMDRTYEFHIGRNIEVTRSTVAWVYPEGDTLTDESSGILLQIPAGALHESMEITIGSVDGIPELPDSVEGLGLSFHFGPDGLVFSDTVTIGLPLALAGQELAGDMDPGMLHLFYYHPSEGDWEALPVSRIDSEYLYVRVARFCYLTGVRDIASSMGGKGTAGGLPDVFRVMRHYPNPFNPSTTVEYALPQAARIRILIYNMKGQVVTVLKDGHEDAGMHSVNWNASDRESGIYFFHIQAEDEVRISKCLLLK
ncbi:choice-of-anchor D domain-containing protein [bacterium]|nr:choice-of-anchor D domain-containing protein [bacterium]